MKAMVIYDSAYGNTARIAETIGDALQRAASSADVQIHQASDVQPDQFRGLDLLVVGSPTQRFRPTAATSDFLKRIPDNSLTGTKIATFDTRFTEEKIKSIGLVLSAFVGVFGYAAKPIAEQLTQKGGEMVAPPEGFYVTDMEGPLLAGEQERAADWARKMAEDVSGKGERHVTDQ